MGIGLFNFVGEFTFEVKASTQPIFFKPFRMVNRVCGNNTKFKYGQQGKRTQHNFDVIFCFLIYSIFAIFLLLYNLLA